MKILSLCSVLVSYVLISCINPIRSNEEEKSQIKSASLKHEFLSDISTPNDFERITAEKNSFPNYLRSLPLKPKNAPVLLYNRTPKSNTKAHEAVIDLPIGKRDLHQCADAVMRLRAEYLFDQKKYDQIHFNFTNGFKAEYARWRKGERISVKGNSVSWKNSTAPNTDYKSFWKYLEMVFSYAGTASLEKELNPKPLGELAIGDVFIQCGFPGHAVIIVDMCVHKENGKKLFMLAQSYMPAQEIHILKNPNIPGLSPWYEADFRGVLHTPEWSFSATDLMSF